jgi:type 1 glutamine amidotransferase
MLSNMRVTRTDGDGPLKLQCFTISYGTRDGKYTDRAHLYGLRQTERKQVTKRILLSLLGIALIAPLLSSERGQSDRTNSVPSIEGDRANRARPSVLYLTHSAGFKHDVLPLSEQILKQIGERSGAFEVTATQDCSALSRDGLKPYDVVVFYTTGELPISDAQKKAFLDFIRAGKGFVGIHSATDTFYKWPEYGELIGGYFDQHPWHQEVTVNVEDQRHPATQHLGKSFKITDEIYQFKDFSRGRVHVLLSLDANSVDLNKPAVHRTDKDFALAWWRNYGKGRVFYTALGHRPEVWQDERFQQHLLGAVRWAMSV